MSTIQQNTKKRSNSKKLAQATNVIPFPRPTKLMPGGIVLPPTAADSEVFGVLKVCHQHELFRSGDMIIYRKDLSPTYDADVVVVRRSNNTLAAGFADEWDLDHVTILGVVVGFQRPIKTEEYWRS